MNTIKLSIVLFVLTSFISSSQNKNLQQVEFLIGTWKMEGKENYESWEKNDNKLIAQVYKIENGQRIISEEIEMRMVKDQLVYTPTVFDQNDGKGIPFRLQSFEEQHFFSFENPNHDFPKKIQYRILNNKELFISVLGENDQGFSYKLIKQVD